MSFHLGALMTLPSCERVCVWVSVHTSPFVLGAPCIWMHRGTQLGFPTEDAGGHLERGRHLTGLFQAGGMWKARSRPEEAVMAELVRAASRQAHSESDRQVAGISHAAWGLLVSH